MKRIELRWIQLHVIYALMMCSFVLSVRSPQVFPDSESYRSGSGIAPWGWISLSGSEYSRGWPIELFYSIFNSDLSRVWMQSLLYIASVILLSYSLFMKLNKSTFGFQVSLITLVFGQLGTLQSWNNFVSRESLSNTLLIICFSIFIFSLTKKYIKYTPIILSTQAVFTTIAIILKPIFYPILLTLIILQIFFHVRDRGNFSPHINRKRFILALIFTLFALLYATSNASNQNIGWSKADPEGRTLKEISFSYSVSRFNPSSQEFIDFLKLRESTEKCSLPNEPIATDNLGEPMIYAGKIRKSCPSFSIYVKENYVKDYITFLIQNPVHLFSTISILSDGSFSFVNLGLSNSLVSPLVDKMLLLNFSMVTNHMILIILIIQMIVMVISFIFRRDNLFKQFFNSSLIFSSLMFSGLISILFSLIFQPTHLGDLSRQSFSANLLVRICFMAQVLYFIRIVYLHIFLNHRLKKIA
jgi:hypothetical protein